MKPWFATGFKRKSTWFNGWCSINGKLVHEQMFTALIASSVFKRLARIICSGDVDSHFLSQTSPSIIKQESVLSNQSPQVVGNVQPEGLEFVAIGPVVEVRIIDPFSPDHGLNVCWKQRLVRNLNLHCLGAGRRSMVIQVHRGAQHFRVDGVNVERAFVHGIFRQPGAIEGCEFEAP